MSYSKGLKLTLLNSGHEDHIKWDSILESWWENNYSNFSECGFLKLTNISPSMLMSVTYHPGFITLQLFKITAKGT